MKSVSKKIEAMVARAEKLDEQIAALESERKSLSKKMSVIDTLFEDQTEKVKTKKGTGSGSGKRGRPKGSKNKPKDKPVATARAARPDSLRAFVANAFEGKSDPMTVDQVRDAVLAAGYDKAQGKSDTFKSTIISTIATIASIKRVGRGVYVVATKSEPVAEPVAVEPVAEVNEAPAEVPA